VLEVPVAAPERSLRSGGTAPSWAADGRSGGIHGTVCLEAISGNVDFNCRRGAKKKRLTQGTVRQAAD